MQLIKKCTSKTRTGICAGLLACSIGMMAMVGTSVPAFATGEQSKSRQWPSQSLPEQPINVRICSCRYDGQSIPIGQTICMKYEGQQVMAKCDTVVNSPSWSISRKPCPQS